ncbi:hypothetical protein Ssed_2140 [Shewanella sediminis HAW-EB3]|uniref:Uncharacterized protein n=1 Tax=Shewanella sediminis (strain HAW-EB3) TaxID=425104 RepID=A8FV76_SHESH|nr:hypothetical protein [Shewanella sediminis]ABV36749.1 hypothetical protein Ssed_2140 [Shewanella sediminis HAW-EB3]
MNKLLLAALLSAVLVSGCSEDSNDTASSPVVPPSPAKEYSTIDVTPAAKFEGSITVRLGRFDDKYKAWRLSGEAKDIHNDGHIDEMDAQALKIVNELEPAIVIDAKKMHSLLQTNPDGLGKGSARADIFVNGHYSVFDVLRYLALTRDDIKLENVIDYKDTDLDTYQFTISWDQNGDGIFDAQDIESFNSSGWHFRFKFDGGELRRITGSLDGVGPEGEAHYERMDQFWVQPGMDLRFQPFNAEMTARRIWVMKQEMERYRQAGNKVILPELVASFDGGKSYETLVTDLEVTAHNIRPDIFQPGVITGIDAFLSAKDMEHDFVINYWPTVASKAPVGHYALFSVNGKNSRVGAGWTTRFGEKSTLNDFAPFTKCDFGSDGTQNGEPKVSHKACWAEWNTYFGGNMLHLMTDVWVMNQAVEQVHLIYKSHYDIFGMEEFNGKIPTERDFSQSNDGSDMVSLRTLSLPKPETSTLPILKESHFGWGIANCESCHNDKLPQGHGGYSWPVNSVDGFNSIQPYYCASCHGSNGAPLGHGETARCYWCHSEDQLPKNHGEASVKQWLRGAENLEGNWHNYNIPASTLPRDAAGNYAPYTEILSTINSDWNMSKSFPDPYSCMTCHPNPE